MLHACTHCTQFILNRWWEFAQAKLVIYNVTAPLKRELNIAEEGWKWGSCIFCCRYDHACCSSVHFSVCMILLQIVDTNWRDIQVRNNINRFEENYTNTMGAGHNCIIIQCKNMILIWESYYNIMLQYYNYYTREYFTQYSLIILWITQHECIVKCYKKIYIYVCVKRLFL